jgi:immunity protein, SdpI family
MTQKATALRWAAVLVIVGMVVGTAIVYPRLPDPMPTHWNLAGEIDGYESKRWGAWMLPGIMLLMLGLFSIIPWLSPRGFKPDRDGNVVWFFGFLAALFCAYLHALVLTAALGVHVDMNRALGGAFAVFVILMANMLGKVERNFYIGIRTPWTLANERVWIQTHRLAAWLGVVGGITGLLLALVPGIPSWLPFAVPGCCLVYPAIHSLILYKRLEGAGDLNADATPVG